LLQTQIDGRVDLETAPAFAHDVIGRTPENGPFPLFVGVTEECELG
jgi:hypothetical protein